MSDCDNPSTGSHFARDLEKILYSVMREGRNVGGSIGSSRSVLDGDDPSTGSHFVRDLEKIHYIIMREDGNVVGPTGSSRSETDGDDPSTGSHFARDLEMFHYIVRGRVEMSSARLDGVDLRWMVTSCQAEVISRKT